MGNEKSKDFRERHGGVEKRGGWKTSRMTPLPKSGFGPPPRTVRFPPPSGVSPLFFLYKNPRESRPEALLEGSKNFRERAFSGTFSSPHTFCTPPYHGPRIGGSGWNENYTDEPQPRDSNRSATNAGPTRTKVCPLNLGGDMTANER